MTLATTTRWGMFADDAKVYVWDDTDNHLVEYPGATNRTLPRTGLTLIEWESLVVADDKLFVLATDSATRKWVAWDFPARTRSATDDVNAGAGLSEADGATFRDNRLWQLLDDTLYAYSLSDAQSIERFPNGDFQLHVDNADVHGMTIDGDDLFTVDDTGLNILGYNSSGNRNSLLDRALDNDNSDPGAIASDDTYFYVTDAEDDQVYRYVRVQTTITNPGIRRMVVWDDRLWGISVDGQLYYTYDFADGWTVDAKVPAFSVPVTDMFVYRNAVADPVIHVMTEEGLWIHDVENGRFEQSEYGFRVPKGMVWVRQSGGGKHIFRWDYQCTGSGTLSYRWSGQTVIRESLGTVSLKSLRWQEAITSFWQR